MSKGDLYIDTDGVFYIEIELDGNDIEFEKTYDTYSNTFRMPPFTIMSSDGSEFLNSTYKDKLTRVSTGYSLAKINTVFGQYYVYMKKDIVKAIIIKAFQNVKDMLGLQKFYDQYQAIISSWSEDE